LYVPPVAWHIFIPLILNFPAHPVSDTISTDTTAIVVTARLVIMRLAFSADRALRRLPGAGLPLGVGASP
jgi:hypothetical protein